MVMSTHHMRAAAAEMRRLLRAIELQAAQLRGVADAVAIASGRRGGDDYGSITSGVDYASMLDEHAHEVDRELEKARQDKPEKLWQATSPKGEDA